MADTDTDTDGLDEAFKDFGKTPAPVTPPVADSATPPETPAVPPVELPKEEPKKEDPKPPEELKKDEVPAKPPEETPPAPADDKTPKEDPKPPETPETPAAPEVPQPLTKDDVKSVVSDLLNTERSSSKELDTTTKEVMDAYYPEGLSNVLIDEKSGKELRSPEDVIEASGGKMTPEQAAQWLLNEQFTLDKQVATIKDQARNIAETTVNFRRDAVSAVQKYEPLFKKYPVLQQKVFDKLMKQTKVDKEKGVILSAPDVMEHYDDYLEPYQLAFEHSTQTSATNPNPSATPDTPEPPKPTAEDRMDEGGDGGASAVADDPNDFAQQVNKELAKGI